jgi:hypothetical protein
MEFVRSVSAWCGGLLTGTFVLMVLLCVPQDFPAIAGQSAGGRSSMNFDLLILVFVFPVVCIIFGTLDLIAQLMLGLRQASSHAKAFTIGFSWMFPAQFVIISNVLEFGGALQILLGPVGRHPVISTLVSTFVFGVSVRWLLSKQIVAVTPN